MELDHVPESIEQPKCVSEGSVCPDDSEIKRLVETQKNPHTHTHTHTHTQKKKETNFLIKKRKKKYALCELVNESMNYKENFLSLGFPCPPLSISRQHPSTMIVDQGLRNYCLAF